MELMSWNVNGIRAAIRKGFFDFLAETKPDVFCLQETRIALDQVDFEIPDYQVHWYPAERRGYSGVAVLTRVEPLAVRRGLGDDLHDREGRVQTLEFPDFYLVNVYTPNAQRGLTRLGYRTEHWDPAFLKHLEKLQRRKPVIFCGDLNVAHKEIDLADPRGNERNAGFTIEERQGFDRIIAAGFIDTFREFTSEGGHYTWWSNFGRARAKNIGWRIDYFGISEQLRPRLAASRILPEVMGSDHCPIALTLG